MLKHWFEQLFFRMSNAITAAIPRAKPSASMLAKCRVISHRGERDDKTVFENTFAAFDSLVETGVWAIELDIRWTQDLQPVVFHDVDCQRLFNDQTRIDGITLAELQAKYPMIPSLSELLARYQGKLHFMIELKQEDYRDVTLQMQRLKDVLVPLTPVKEYHLISIFPEQMFSPIDFVPSQTFLTIMRVKSKSASRFALEKQHGGFLGHYVFVRNSLVKKHLNAGQQVGVGFVDSKNSLLRELNRGVEWIYTNHALNMQEILEQLRGD
tara:strand:+ start:13975 stop:14778 length:804 start_codon:yes stop_codon:yes gene_type:complete